MSQAALAKELNVSKSTVGLWETGDTLPDAKSLYALAKIFGVNGDYLLCLSDVTSTDADVATVCKATGLKEDLAKFFVDCNSGEYSSDGLDLIPVFNSLFSPLALCSLLANVATYSASLAEFKTAESIITATYEQPTDAIFATVYNQLEESEIDSDEKQLNNLFSARQNLRMARFETIDSFTRLFDNAMGAQDAEKRMEALARLIMHHDRGDGGGDA